MDALKKMSLMDAFDNPKSHLVVSYLVETRDCYKIYPLAPKWVVIRYLSITRETKEKELKQEFRIKSRFYWYVVDCVLFGSIGADELSVQFFILQNIRVYNVRILV